MYSSSTTTVSPLRPGMATGVISAANRPAFCACSARFWEPAAKRSWSSRVICQRPAMFSAVWPMW